MQEKRHYLFIDFEFTMPEIRKKDEKRTEKFIPEIIEAGIVHVIEDEVQEKISTYVKPTINPILSENCKSLLNITQSNVDNGITLKELADIFRKLDKEKCTVVTWGGSDMQVLRQNCRNADLPFPLSGKEVDLSIEYQNFNGDQQQTGLRKAVQQYGELGTGVHHRALDDALTTLNLFQLFERDRRYLKKTEPTTIGDRVDFSNLLTQLSDKEFQ